MKKAIEEIVKEFLKNPEKDIELIKREICKKYSLKTFIRNSDIIKELKQEKKLDKNLLLILKKSPSRTMSGVTPVAVMSFSGCPHSGCIYCPRGKEAAQSYTGEEPAALRARQNNFDAYKQVKARLKQYKEMGHSMDKCELIIMGGTFLSNKEKYKKSFIKDCFDAFNNKKSKTLKEAQKLNEKAEHRIVGLTIETRPDYVFIDEMLSYGCTRVELGVQVLSDKIYKKVNRGHSLKDVIDATKKCKEAGLKITYHIMPGLFQTPKQDIQMFKKLFSDSDFKPDMLKIYPTMVMENTKLYDIWKKGKFKPYSAEQAAEVISECYKYIPEYVRVMRVQRDIPTPLITAGVEKSNLRQLVEEKCKKKKIKIKEIRYREAGLQKYKFGKDIQEKNIKLKIKKYTASEGTEYFISFEDTKNNILIGFVRLRICADKKAIVRELHVYGSEINIGLDSNESVQHKGYGKRLLKKAEEITKKNKINKLYIISGIGVREYYYKLGYSLDGFYVSKIINK
ncbi:MAG: tRNA uridine(34) 5-carboxymethylaminomethyl modification radical SAM/GNAT enzyme Elp3 [Candidatus Micrarchaeia archaeon]|jgi:elongator complex protein 3